MRISSQAVRTLLISGMLGALAFTTTGCQDDKPEKVKPPVASASAVTPSASASPSPTPSASPSATPSSTPPVPTPPAPKAPPKPKTNSPSLPPPMNDGGGNGGSSSGGGGGSVYYQNCAAVRAAGAAPLHRGDPGYAAHLDRDGDGIACEK
ncbi:excalibur calcium-binding domain-containing protein [Streptomyces violascens]|uniref:excalibur calcium-binding domain-containing protein n=1 Tax=Streptomyces violascens TaxID=67381 RepID=UPI0036482183